MPPAEPNDEERQEELPQDNQTPFNPAEPPRADAPADAAQPAPSLDPTHPVTDSNIQPEEVYEEGVPGAAEASEPNAGAVVNADPSNPSDDNPDDNEDPNPEIEDTAL